MTGRTFRYALALPAMLVHSLAFAAPTTDACIDANAKAQDFRRDGRLTAARDQLAICSDAACPAIIRGDCTKRRDELEAAQPTIVFTAKTASGTDRIDVTVTIDGKPLADSLTGAALAIDPGQHVLGFTANGEPTVTRSILVIEGQKGRREELTFPSAAAISPAPTNAANAPTPAPRPLTDDTRGQVQPDGANGLRTVGIVATGAGVAALAAGGAFGALSFSRWAAAKSDCGAGCSATGPAQAEKSSAELFGNLSTAGFIAGGVLVATGLTLVLTAPKTAGKPDVGLTLAPGSAFVSGRF